MPLEAVMVCIDNSDYTRNGDYTPTRFDAQTDAVNLVCGAKTQQNPETSVGLLTSAGDRVEVVITPTMELGKINVELCKLKNGGTSDLLRAIQTAQLALKHRQNKNQKQRIIAFVGSPVTNTEKELETLGKNLKKNNVSLDVVSFGEVEENNAKLEKLLTAVNSNETSHLVEVPVGPKLLSDVILSSVIINADGDGGGMGGAGGGGEGFEFGINANDDPELALALRISMEEERARQQAADGGAAAQGGAAAAEAAGAPAAAPAAAAPAAAAPAAAAPAASNDAVMEAIDMEDMDEELRQAILLSMQEAGGPPPAQADAPAAPEPAAPAPAPAPAAPAAPAAAAQDAPMPEAAAAKPSMAGYFEDPSFVESLLGSLPGVNPNDPAIQAALQEIVSDNKDKKEEEAKKDGGGGGSGSGGS